MNGLIPALIAVLLAEIGERGAAASGAPSRLYIGLVAALVAASAIAGNIAAPFVTTPAATLMTGISLLYAGLYQLRPADVSRPLTAFWLSGTPLIVFALAARFGSVPVAIGSFAGLGGAAALSSLGAANIRVYRLVAAVLLLLGGIVAAIAGLRLA